jgi:hypothetical protein
MAVGIPRPNPVRILPYYSAHCVRPPLTFTIKSSYESITPVYAFNRPKASRARSIEMCPGSRVVIAFRGVVTGAQFCICWKIMDTKAKETQLEINNNWICCKSLEYEKDKKNLAKYAKRKKWRFSCKKMKTKIREK